jgi:Ca-activated chloride channel family protein
MILGVDPRAVRFDAPEFLWLLLIPGLALALWVRWGWKRWFERGAFAARRVVPIRERLSLLGDLPYWLCLTVATALAVSALARPVVTTSLLRTAGVDVIILQDGSASMHVMDVQGDRWRRSVRFLRTIGESLRWKDDRIAMSVFAHIAAPQVRLTTDPNTFFFFLDHLQDQSPFRLEDDTTWDTNTELGIYWGLRLVEKDEELNGRSPNGKVFVLISDGQTWSGEVEKSLRLARARNIPVIVVGVGTTRGGMIPDAMPTGEDDAVPQQTRFSPIRSVLDRASLAAIAAEGDGRYFELDREGDRDIANAIIDAARRRAGSRGVEEQTVELYWPCLAAAAALMCVGTLFLRSRAELTIQLAGAVALWAIVVALTR